jgi:hypothetical protein
MSRLVRIDCPAEPVLSTGAWASVLPALLVDEIDRTVESVFNDDALAEIATDCALSFWACRKEFEGGYPLALMNFYRQCGNVDAEELADSIANNSVDADMTWVLAIESKSRNWPQAVVTAADKFRDSVIDAAGSWDWIANAEAATEQKIIEKQHCKCTVCVCD